MTRKQTIPVTPDWKNAFKSHSLRVGFQVALSRTMLEYLSAVADDCEWDRVRFGLGGIHNPPHCHTTGEHLVKRGLIRRLTEDEYAERDKKYDVLRASSDDTPAHHRLTPAGEHVVALVKLAGVFMESDAAITRKARRA